MGGGKNALVMPCQRLRNITCSKLGDAAGLVSAHFTIAPRMAGLVPMGASLIFVPTAPIVNFCHLLQA